MADLIAVMTTHELTTTDFSASVRGGGGERLAAMRTADVLASVTTTAHHCTASLVTNKFLRLEATNFFGVVATGTRCSALDCATIAGRIMTEFLAFVQTTRQNFAAAIFTSWDCVSAGETFDVSRKTSFATRTRCVGGRISRARRTSVSTSERFVTSKITLAVSTTEIL